MNADSIRQLVQLAQDPEYAGGAFKVHRLSEVGTLSDPLIAFALPIAARQVSVQVANILDAIESDWIGSGQKEQRRYSLQIFPREGAATQARVWTRVPTPVTAEDLSSRAMKTSLDAVNAAAATIAEPYKLLKKQNKALRKQAALDREEIVSLREEARAAKAELRAHQGQHAEAIRHQLEGEAAILLAKSQASAIERATDTAVAEFPKLMGAALTMLGHKGLGKAAEVLFGKPGQSPGVGPPPNVGAPPKATGAPPRAAPSGASPEPAEANPKDRLRKLLEDMKPFPPELDAKLRAIPLSSVELARVFVTAWMLDQELAFWSLSLSEETVSQLFALRGEIFAHMKGGT